MIINQDRDTKENILQVYKRKHCPTGKWTVWNVYGIVDTKDKEILLGTFDTEAAADYCVKLIEYYSKYGIDFVVPLPGTLEEAVEATVYIV